MATRNLAYSILEQCDCDIITFLDTSTYAVEPDNAILRIFPPDFNSYYSIRYNPQQITLIRASSLRHECLPSGLYHIVQSVCPNEATEVESCYLHVCPERDRIMQLACEDPSEELSDLLMELDIAQRLAKEHPKKGIELLNKVKERLDEIETVDNKCFK